jgi:hypothetical protein
MTKFCKDCANYRGSDTCSLSQGKFDLVTGESVTMNFGAYNQRYNPDNNPDHCGKEAQYFVPKAPQVQLLTETRPEMTDGIGKWRRPDWWDI